MKKIKNNLIYILIGFCVVVSGIMVYASMGKTTTIDKKNTNSVDSKDKSDTNPTGGQTNSTAVPQKTDNPPAGVAQDASNLPATAIGHYWLGLENLNKNKFNDAVTEFAEAIKLDAKEPNYYVKKSEAQYKLGQKDQAIETINIGLQKIPGNNLLQDQLDILKSL